MPFSIMQFQSELRIVAVFFSLRASISLAPLYTSTESPFRSKTTYSVCVDQIGEPGLGERILLREKSRVFVAGLEFPEAEHRVGPAVYAVHRGGAHPETAENRSGRLTVFDPVFRNVVFLFFYAVEPFDGRFLHGFRLGGPFLASAAFEARRDASRYEKDGRTDGNDFFPFFHGCKIRLHSINIQLRKVGFIVIL